MTKTFDELMKLLDEKGSIPDEDAKKLIKEHGDLADDEKKQLAAAIKMKKALTADKKDEKKEDEKKDGDQKDEKKDGGEVTMDDYLQALSVLDSEEASADDKKKAEQVKAKFESQ